MKVGDISYVKLLLSSSLFYYFQGKEIPPTPLQLGTKILPEASTLFLLTKSMILLFCLTIYSPLLAESHHQSKNHFYLF